MPDDLLHTPLPDLAHEALRVAVMQAIDDLTEQVDRLKSVFLLLSVTGDMAQATLLTVQSAKTTMAEFQTTATTLGGQFVSLQGALADLTARVDALDGQPQA